MAAFYKFNLLIVINIIIVVVVVVNALLTVMSQLNHGWTLYAVTDSQ